MFLGLLEQLQGPEVNKPQTSIVYGGQKTIISSGVSQPITQMVGSSAKELESLNELIKFDHVYHKTQPAPRSIVAMDTIQQQQALPVTTAATTNNTVPTVSVPSYDDDNNGTLSLNDIESLANFLNEDLLSMVTNICDISKESGNSGAIDATQNSNMHKSIPPPLTHMPPVNTLSPGSYSDSGYSDLSDAASPRSDISSALSSDELWEESFTELFPSLV